ncbi:non-ribosomal peptide synthetase [Streptomyces sp. NPDC127033]|uniref:non-ribosomal peptide synthetase n=1 Tax=Streptomyces sp. NPDC127033 TaxID=3347110 RepID=UPI00364B74DF
MTGSTGATGTTGATAAGAGAATGAGAGAGRGALQALVEQFTRVPDRTAIVVGTQALTYRELDAASAALAARLAAAGVRPGRTVVLYQRQTVRAVVGMVAAARIGAAWCVVAAGHPARLVRALLDDIDCGAVVFDPEDPATPADAVAALAGGARGPAPAVLEQDAPGPAAPFTDPTRPVPGSTPAYVITTSGSTGVPKAVVVTAANLEAMHGSRNYPYEESRLVTFSAMRLTWDGSLMQTLWAMRLGGTAVLPGDGELSDADAAARLAGAWRASHLVATPSFYRLMLPALASAGVRPQLVVLGGESVPVALAERHRALLPGAELRNEYGPTETTVSCVTHPVRAADEPVVPIGRPTSGSTAYVLDGRLAPVRPGEVGELYIGGPQVAAGYAARPAETSARFVPDPFTGRAGARMYRTGDLAREKPDGDLEFRGRTDGQLKVRGARIECRAVESALESHPAVGRAVVLGVSDAHAEISLVAFWTPAGNATPLPGTRELLAFCAERMIPAAVPERFVALGGFPLGPSGKADEAALRALLPGAGARAPLAGRQRWTPTQRSLAEMWTAVLQHDDFGPHDGFFQVGGNSRRVVELHLRMERARPGALRVGQLFELLTVAEQAAALDEAVAGAERPGRPEPGEGNDERVGYGNGNSDRDGDGRGRSGTGTGEPVLFEI